MPTIDPAILDRVSVVGSTCAGKTTFSSRLSSILGHPHVELDAIQWMANWTPRDPESFRAAALLRMAEDRWVVDGNYGRVRPEIWSRATAIVWLNYPYLRVLCRLIRRTFTRVASREELWNGNRETLRGTLLDSDSLFFWLLKTHWQRIRRFRRELELPVNRHLTVFEFTRPQQAESFLRNIDSQTRSTPKRERALT